MVAGRVGCVIGAGNRHQPVFAPAPGQPYHLRRIDIANRPRMNGKDER
jgi:hypothetical protein